MKFIQQTIFGAPALLVPFFWMWTLGGMSFKSPGFSWLIPYIKMVCKWLVSALIKWVIHTRLFHIYIYNVYYTLVYLNIFMNYDYCWRLILLGTKKTYDCGMTQRPSTGPRSHDKGQWHAAGCAHRSEFGRGGQRPVGAGDRDPETEIMLGCWKKSEKKNTFFV